MVLNFFMPFLVNQLWILTQNMDFMVIDFRKTWSIYTKKSFTIEDSEMKIVLNFLQKLMS